MAKHATLQPPPDPPKKALTCFFLYRKQVYEDVKRDNPDARITEITKIIGEMWSNVDKETRSRLDAEYQTNRAKVANEKEQYEQKYGKIQGARRKGKKEKTRKK